MKNNLNLLKTVMFSLFFLFLGCREEMHWTKNQQEKNRAEEFFKNNYASGRANQRSTSVIHKLKKINKEPILSPDYPTKKDYQFGTILK